MQQIIFEGETKNKMKLFGGGNSSPRLLIFIEEIGLKFSPLRARPVGNIIKKHMQELALKFLKKKYSIHNLTMAVIARLA